jgi:hypothetical protein
MACIPCRVASQFARGGGRLSPPSGIASARLGRRQRKPVDIVSRYFRLSLRMLFEKTSTVSVPGQASPIRIASGSLATRGNRIPVRIAKPSSRSVTDGGCRREAPQACAVAFVQCSQAPFPRPMLSGKHLTLRCLVFSRRQNSVGAPDGIRYFAIRHFVSVAFEVSVPWYRPLYSSLDRFSPPSSA